MAKNLDGNEIGVIIEADSLLTQIAKQRNVKVKPVKVETKPRATQKPAAIKKA